MELSHSLLFLKIAENSTELDIPTISLRLKQVGQYWS